jgi:predicted DNA-binding transcriptional regulator AlpA
MTASGPRKMLLEAQVLDIVPISRSTLWRMERAGKFPRGTFIAPNRKVWFEEQIIDWQNTVNEFQPTRRRGKVRRAAAAAQPDPADAVTAKTAQFHADKPL